MVINTDVNDITDAGEEDPTAVAFDVTKDVDEKELVDIIVLDPNRNITKYNLRPRNVLALYAVKLNANRHLELLLETENSGLAIVKPFCSVA